MIILPGEQSPVNTGIALVVPPRTYARIAPQSGLVVKHGIDIGAGVIDKDYRGEIKVVLINNSSIPFQVQPGDRIAQLILEKILSCYGGNEGLIRNNNRLSRFNWFGRNSKYENHIYS
jgi:dUTP pyrophosphatase